MMMMDVSELISYMTYKAHHCREKKIIDQKKKRNERAVRILLVIDVQ